MNVAPKSVIKSTPLNGHEKSALSEISESKITLLRSGEDEFASETDAQSSENSESSENSTEIAEKSAKLNLTPVSSKPNKGIYKLSLCKETTHVMSRKRMLHKNSPSPSPNTPKRIKFESNRNEFQSVNEESSPIVRDEPKEEVPEPIDNQVEMEQSNSSTRNENCDTKSFDEFHEKSDEIKATLQNEIDDLKTKISTIQKHEERTTELQEVILKWQEAGLKVLDELKEKTNTNLDEKDILAHFRIDPKIFNLD